jgi:AcrR family transcriptional regulator
LISRRCAVTDATSVAAPDAALAELGPRALRTRDGILAASRTLFLTHGYASTRINHITAACGISRAGFYTYFRDKREVFNALGEAAYHAMLAIVGEWDGLPEAATVADIERWTARYFAVMDEHGSFIFASEQSAPSDADFRASSNRLQMRVAWSFGTRLQRRQRTPTDSPDALGLAMLAMLDRSWFGSRSVQLPVDDSDMIRTVARCIVAILHDR